MNEVESMDLSERSRLHSPPFAYLISDECNENVSKNVASPSKSSCAITNKGATTLENGNVENCVLNNVSEYSDSLENELPLIKTLEEVKSKTQLNHAKGEETDGQAKDSTSISTECSTSWKFRICPTLVDKQLENNCSELLLSNSSKNSPCSTVKNHIVPANYKLEKDESDQTDFFQFSEGCEEKTPTLSSVTSVAFKNCIEKTDTFPENESKCCLLVATDNPTDIFKLGEAIAENNESEVERSDGSDSGLGSELADEKLELVTNQEGADSEVKTAEIDAGIVCDGEGLQEGTTELDSGERCDGSDSGLGSELADERTDSDPCQQESTNSANEASVLEGETSSCLETEDDKSEFQIEAPALDDLKTPSFEEIRSPCSAFDDIKENSEPLRTPQPNLDFPICSIYEKPIEAKALTTDILKTLSQNRTPLKSSLKRKSTEPDLDVPPKKKRSINFNKVSVYYFPRAQGFTCVPSQGGSTLGMSLVHSHVQQFTLSEHAVEQRRLHRLMLQRLRNERLQPPSDTDDTESDEEPTDDEEDEMDLDSYYFLQVIYWKIDY